MDEQYCEGCNGYGFDVFDKDCTGNLEIERCDVCSKTDDNTTTKLVGDMAKAALDLADNLSFTCDRKNPPEDLRALYVTVDAYRKATWP